MRRQPTNRNRRSGRVNQNTASGRRNRRDIVSRATLAHSLVRNNELLNLSDEKVSRSTDVTSSLSQTAMMLPYAPVFQQSIRKRLIYYDYGVLSSTSGVLGNYVFSANGLFDPNITGVGHQPSGFDQLMVFYDHYVVVAAKATVNFVNQSTSATPLVALSLNSSNSPASDFTILNESGLLIKDRLMNGGIDGSIKTLVQSVDIARFQGVQKIRDDPELWGSIASNPVEQTYFNLSVWDPQGVSAGVAFNITLEYDAWFLEPRKLTTSLTKSIHQALRAEERLCQKTK